MTPSFDLFSQRNLFAAAFFLLLAGLLWLLFSLLQPFLPAFLWALILAMVFYPVYSKILQWTGQRNNLAAALTLLAALLLLSLPGTLLMVNLGQEVGKTYDVLATTDWKAKSDDWVARLDALGLQESLARWGVDSRDVSKLFQNGVTSLVVGFNRFVLDRVKDLLQNLLEMTAMAGFVLFCLFFFFRDGPKYTRRVVEFLPLSPRHRDEVVDRFSKTVSSVVRAMFLTALAQGLAAGVGFMIFGVPFPLLLGLLTFAMSFVPFVGATAVWLPAALWLYGQDRTGAAIGLALWGVFVISLLDNVIKPLVIREGVKLPLFLIFFTILGGLKLYGFLGIFLGPIILSMGLAFLAIYQDLYLRPKTEKPAGSTHRARKPRAA